MNITHATWSTEEVRESKLYHTNAIYSHSTDPEVRKVQCVGIIDNLTENNLYFLARL